MLECHQNVKMEKIKGVNYFKEFLWAPKQLHGQLLAARREL